jgi:hypothetical protein
MEIRFSRHAKNKVRHYKLTVEEVEKVIISGEKTSEGEKWESRKGNLKVIWITIGFYALVVTVIRTKRS